jgi:hypothetical protein
MIKSLLKKSLVAMAASAMLAAGAAAPALAESSGCTFAINPLGNDGCTTGSVGANRSGHFIYMSVSPNVHWEVYDISNNVTVGHGQAGVLGKRKTITGLYGRYKLEIHGLVGHGSINNN